MTDAQRCTEDGFPIATIDGIDYVEAAGLHIRHTPLTEEEADVLTIRASAPPSPTRGRRIERPGRWGLLRLKRRRWRSGYGAPDSTCAAYDTSAKLLMDTVVPPKSRGFHTRGIASAWRQRMWSAWALVACAACSSAADGQPPGVIALPPKVVTFAADFVVVGGAWKFARAEDQGTQRQAVELVCDRATMQCTEVIAMYNVSDGTATLAPWLERWTVDSWDDVQLTARAVADYPCARYTLTINRVQRSARRVRSKAADTPMCSYMRAEDLVLNLVDGTR